MYIRDRAIHADAETSLNLIISKKSGVVNHERKKEIANH